MVCGSERFSKTSKRSFCAIIVLIYFVTQLCSVNGIPINFAKNNANRGSHNQPPVPMQRQPSQNQQPQQNSQNQGPEMEDFGRLHTNQNQFRRHAIVPPDVKVTSGAFQQHPSEQFGKPGGTSGSGTNFRYSKFDESFQQQQHSNHIFRHETPPPYPQVHSEEAQEFYRQSHEHRHTRRHSPDVPPPSPSNSNFNHNHPNQNTYQQGLNDNEIFRERNTYSHIPPKERENSFTSHWGNSPVEQRQEQQPQQVPIPNTFNSYPGQKSFYGKPKSNHQVPSSIPQPTAIAIVVPGVNGSSTLFIEYDISDNAVTYETTVEVEDAPDSLIYSKHGSYFPTPSLNEEVGSPMY